MLSVNDLTVKVQNGNTLLNHINFKVDIGECIGLTGASGSGKTTIIKAIMGILDRSCRITEGKIVVDEENILTKSQRERRALCGTTLGFIPQNPMTAFYPHKNIGRQMNDTFCFRLNITNKEANSLSRDLLKKMNLDDADRILGLYPKQLSGGMLQRITMAILLGLKPSYLLADEPTSALDECNSYHLLEVLRTYNSETAIIFISHDIEAIKSLCSKLLILQNGSIIESNNINEIFLKPTSKWTKNFVRYLMNRKDVKKWRWKDLK